MFAEIDPQLAARARDRGRRLDDDRSPSARRSRRAPASPTACGRWRSTARCVHQVALPWHWGYAGRRRATRPTTSACCRAIPNVSIQESKAFVCNVRAGPARRATRRRADRHHAPPAGRRARHRTTPRRSPATHERDRDPAGRRAAHGLLHRHDRLHRLQGVRGRVQAVERPARRRRQVPHGRLLRQHRRGCRRHLAPRALRRAATPTAASSRPDLRARPTAVDSWRRCHVRRLQALHERRLPRRLPDRRADPHRVRHRRASSPTSATAAATASRRARSASSTAMPTTAAPASARSATTASRTASSPACAKACPTDSIQFGPYDELRRGRAAARRRAARARRRGRLPLRRRRRGRRPARGRARRVLPADRDSPSATGCRRTPTRRSRRTSCRPRSPRWAPGCWRRPASRPRSCGRRRDERRARRPRRPRSARPPRRRSARRPARRWRCTSASGRTAAGRTSTATTPTTRTPSSTSRTCARRRSDAREGELPKIIQGPILNPPVWTWEVPLYFWFGGIAAGSSFVALACDRRRRRALGGGRAQGRARRARPVAACC